MNYYNLISIMPKGAAYDADAQAFITATGISGTNANAINQLVLDLKAASIWTKMKAIYPMIGGTATTHKFNLKDSRDLDAAFRLNFVGGWTHSATGAKPNGTNAYADTFFIPANNATLNSNHISYYSRDTSNGTEVEIGCASSNSSNDSGSLIEIRTSGVTYYRVNSIASYINFSDSDSKGFYIANRTGANAINGWKNNIKAVSGGTSSFGLSIKSFTLGAYNAGTLQFYSTKQCAFASIGDGLTDLEAQLFYQITEKYQVALGRNINPTQSFYYNSAYNNETNAFLFSTQITDNTIQTATNTLVSDLKTANIWTKMKAVYPMVGGTATTHKFNLVNSQDSNAAFRLTFAGGITHSSTGITGNGTNGYANTQFNPSVSSTLNNTHISFYSRTNNDTTAIDVGNSNGSGSQWLMALRFTGVGTISDQYNSTTGRITTAQSDSRGLFIGSRTTSAIHKAFKNGIQIGSTNTGASGSFQNLNITLLASNQNNIPVSYSSRECAFASIGDGLTDAEALALYNATQTFQTTLGRQV